MSTVVTYFSASGVTRNKAQQLAKVAKADLYEIKPAVAYTSADLNWMDKKSRSTLESQDPSSRPALADKKPNLDKYDTVYIGFPIWWYIAPKIINTFIEAANLTGKKIYLFATSGGSGIDKSIKDLKAQYKNLNIVGGKMLNGKVTDLA